MRLTAFFILSALLLMARATAADYDLNKPFGFCTSCSMTEGDSYDISGGGCYSYPIPNDFTGRVVVLKSNGKDMKSEIESAFQQNDVIILDGSKGDFLVSGNIEIRESGKTLLGVNNARLCTQWYVTDEIKKLLDDNGVPGLSTNSGTGGTLSNGQRVSEAAEMMTRQLLIDYTGDPHENYRTVGIMSLHRCSNVIIRNITFVGPGSIDVGGKDLLTAFGATHCWVDHCVFMDGMDGNFDITMQSNYITVSWCTFSYTARSYMHQNTNLVGSGDRFAMDEDFLNTTFAFNWWGTGCKQRMPMARYGTIHMLNNYYSCTTADRCINARKNSEFLIEGNYFDEGVRNVFSQNDAKRWTWASSNYCAELFTPSSSCEAVTVPYDYIVAPASDVPALVKEHAGATLFTQIVTLH